MQGAVTHQYREGGWGWFVVLSAFLAQFIVTGSIKGFGVLLSAMTKDFDEQLGTIGSIVSVHLGALYCLSPVATAIATNVGSRYVVTVGGILYGLGLVFASTTQNLAVEAMALVGMGGLGAACVIQPTHGEIAFYFQEKYALASFIALAGAPVGMLLYGPMTQVLLETYGWRGAMLLIGGIGFHLIACSMLLKRPASVQSSTSYGLLPSDAPGSGVQITQQEPVTHSARKYLKQFTSAVGLDIFENLEFIIVAVIRMFWSIGYGGILVYVVPNGLSLGLSTSEASFLSTAWGLGSMTGLFLTAMMLHFNIISFHAMAGIAAVVTTIGFALVPHISLFTGQIVNTFIIGIGMDCILEVVSVMTRCLPFSEEKLISVLGWQIFLGGMATILGDVISGCLHDVTGGFQATFFVFSASILSIAFCFIVDIFRAFYIKRLK